MKMATIAARFLQTAIDMEILAAADGELDFPDELLLPFIINALSEKRMLEHPAAAPRIQHTRLMRYRLHWK